MNLDVQRKAGDGVSREIARNCLLTRTRQISRVLTAIYDEELRPFGIASSQFTLLVLIMELGPLSRSDLGRKNHHDRSTLTRNLQPLMSQGWVADRIHGGSRPIGIRATSGVDACSPGSIENNRDYSHAPSDNGLECIRHPRRVDRPGTSHVQERRSMTKTPLDGQAPVLSSGDLLGVLPRSVTPPVRRSCERRSTNNGPREHS